MKPPILMGVVLAVVIAAGILVVPRLLHESQGAAAVRLSDKAGGDIARFDPSLRGVAREVDADVLKAADADKLVTAAQAEFDAIAKQLSEAVARMKRQDGKVEKRGIKPTNLAPLSASASSVRAAITEFESARKQNYDLLSAAADDARKALAEGKQAPAVAQMAGAVAMARAWDALFDARAAREAGSVALARLVALAQDIKQQQAEADQFSAFDPAAALKALSADAAEIEQQLAAAQSLSTTLTTQVDQLKRERDEVRAQLQQGRAALLSLEERGFRPGDDAAFGAFRQQYQEQSARLVSLAEREQLLTAGGLKGGALKGDDTLSAPIEGAEPFSGLDELSLRLAAAQDQVKRLTQARQSLADMVRQVDERAKNSQTLQKAYTDRIAALRAELDKTRTQASELAQAAFAKESAALDAARAAEKAYADAASASSAFINAASQLKNSFDAAGKNERLALILRKDPTSPLIGPALQAEARLLTGRIFAFRAAGLFDYLNALTRVAENVPSVTFDSEERAKELATAQQEGAAAINQALTTFQNQAGATTPTSWMPQAAVAYAYHLLSLLTPEAINPTENAKLRALAREALAKAIAKNEKNPRLRAHVSFLEHLMGSAGEKPADTGETPATDPNKPAEAPAGEG